MSFRQACRKRTRVVDYADQDTNDVRELYSVPSSGGTPTRLNGPLVARGDVCGLYTSSDGSRVLFPADQDADNIREAYVRVVRNRANAGGDDWDTLAMREQAVLRDAVMQVF